MADGFIRTGPADVERMREDLRLAEEAARAAGRDPSRLGFAQRQNAFPWVDGDAWDVVRGGAAHQTGVYRGWAAGGDTPGKGFVIGQVDDATLRTLTPAGQPEELVRILRPQVEAFGERKDFHLIFRLHYPGMAFETAAGAVELFGERVLPALKGT